MHDGCEISASHEAPGFSQRLFGGWRLASGCRMKMGILFCRVQPSNAPLVTFSTCQPRFHQFTLPSRSLLSLFHLLCFPQFAYEAAITTLWCCLLFFYADNRSAAGFVALRRLVVVPGNWCLGWPRLLQEPGKEERKKKKERDEISPAQASGSAAQRRAKLKCSATNLQPSYRTKTATCVTSSSPSKNLNLDSSLSTRENNYRAHLHSPETRPRSVSISPSWQLLGMICFAL